MYIVTPQEQAYILEEIQDLYASVSGLPVGVLEPVG